MLAVDWPVQRFAGRCHTRVVEYADAGYTDGRLLVTGGRSR